MRFMVQVPVVVVCDTYGRTVAFNLANVAYVIGRERGAAVYLTNEDSVVIKQTPLEFAELAAEATKEAIANELRRSAV